MFSSDPVSRLSRQITRCPLPSRCSQRWEPRNPAPPVTTQVVMAAMLSACPGRFRLPRTGVLVRRKLRVFRDDLRAFGGRRRPPRILSRQCLVQANRPDGENRTSGSEQGRRRGAGGRGSAQTGRGGDVRPQRGEPAADRRCATRSATTTPRKRCPAASRSCSTRRPPRMRANWSAGPRPWSSTRRSRCAPSASASSPAPPPRPPSRAARTGSRCCPPKPTARPSWPSATRRSSAAARR